MKYTIKADGKLHTRYSELMRCSNFDAALKVAKEKINKEQSFSNTDMGFGEINHKSFQEESERTGKLPVCFGIDKDVQAIEQEYAVEIFEGIVLHFRPDAVSYTSKTVFDYKTMNWREDKDITAAIQQYKNKRQLKIYAYGLMIHGHPIKKTTYLFELWDKKEMEIKGYESLAMDFRLRDIANIKAWLRPRAYALQIAMETLKSEAKSA